jgi:hypothetical protein
MKKFFLLSAILILAGAAQAQRASMVPPAPNNAAPSDSGRSRFFTNCLYDDDDYIYVPVEIDPDAPSAQYHPVSSAPASTSASAPASNGGATAPSARGSSRESHGVGRSVQPDTFIALPQPSTPAAPLGDVARAYRAQKATTAEKAKVVAEQDNNGKIILVPQKP